MNSKTFKCEIITPMFAGSAIPGECELRPPAIKGALRYWWRAINAHRGVDEVREQEALLFGTSDEKAGRSKFDLQIHSANLRTGDSNSLEFSAILKYLSFGVHEYAIRRDHVPAKKCYLPNQHFMIEFTFRSKEIEEQILPALWALSKFGGIGSRSRNGFGKVWISEFDERASQSDSYSIEAATTDYTGFSKKSRLFQSTGTHSSWKAALSPLGMKYKDFRSSIDGRRSIRNCEVICQPIIDPQEDPPTNRTFLERHAKCSFFSVIPEKDGNGNRQYRGQILVLPYEFLAGLNDSSIEVHLRDDQISECRSRYLSVHNRWIEKLTDEMKSKSL